MNTYPEPPIGSCWRHFKGNLYKVVAVATDERTLQRGVVYANIAEPEKVWFRTLADFFSEVTIKDTDGVRTTRRFVEEPG